MVYLVFSPSDIHLSNTSVKCFFFFFPFIYLFLITDPHPTWEFSPPSSVPVWMKLMLETLYALLFDSPPPSRLRKQSLL